MSKLKNNKKTKKAVLIIKLNTHSNQKGEMLGL